MYFDTWSMLYLLSLIAAAGLFLVNLSVLRKPTVDKRKALTNLAFQLDMAVWTAARLLGHTATDLSAAYAWDKVDWAALSLFPPAWLAVAIAWSGRRNWLTPGRLSLLALPGLALGLSALSNDWHWLFFTSEAYIDGVGRLVVSGGPLYYALGALSCVYISVALILFAGRAWDSAGRVRRLSVLVLSITAIPAGVGALGFLGGGQSATEIAQLVISAGGSTFSFFVLRHWLVDVVKTALTQAAENVGDAILVIDLGQKVIDANRASTHILSMERANLVGRPVQALIEDVGRGNDNMDQIMTLFDEWKVDPDRQIDVSIESPVAPARIFWMVGWPIRDDDGSTLGHVLTLRDVTANRETERALQISEARYRGLFENATDMVYTHDLQGYFTSLNKSTERITGYSLEKDGRFSLDDVVAPDQRSFAQQLLTQKQADPLRTSFEIDVLAKDGRRLTVQVNSTLLFDRGKPIAMQGIARDVTEARAVARRQAQMVAHLRSVQQTALSLNSQHDLESLLHQVLAGVRQLMNPDQARVLVLNAAGTAFAIRSQIDESGTVAMTSIESIPDTLARSIMEERTARFVEDIADQDTPHDSDLSEGVQAYAGLPLITPDRLVGTLYVTYYQRHAFSDDERQLLQIMANHAAVAVANSRLLEDLKQAATTDPLTGLANHRCLMDQLDEEMARARRNGHAFAVLMVDIDGFKLINDTHGHTVGDDLLRIVARTMRESLRSTDILGRYGGDEFMALLPETPSEGVPIVCERVLASIAAQGFEVASKANSDARPGPSGSKDEWGNQRNHTTLPVRLSIGAAVFPTDSATRLEIISLADAAMYASKRSGGGILTMAHATDVGFLAAQNNTFSVLEGLVTAVDNKDHYTRSHSEHVAKFALRLADTLGMDPDAKRLIRIAALLHDVGKIGIPDHILRKPGPLDAAETETVRQHPLLSEMVMRETPQLVDVLDAVRHHHERYDGKGYPRELRGEEIPFAARILAIADSFSAMVTDRPYRKALSLDEATDELRKGAGSQFDPNLVEPFISLICASPQFAAVAGAGA
ncbi:MAG: diguanylate cyclase [Dehalococcoidia bacterium]|nr:diguanylate cyclase [Dehalococcoidia bacterium]